MDGNKKFYAAVVVFLAVIFTLSYYVIQSGQQDTYTVLYFSNPIEPLIYNPAENTITVNFTVENHENQAYDYIYAINMLCRNGIKSVSNPTHGKIELGDKETISISRELAIEGFCKNIKVSVQLYKEGINETYRGIWHEKTI